MNAVETLLQPLLDTFKEFAITRIELREGGVVLEGYTPQLQKWCVGLSAIFLVREHSARLDFGAVSEATHNV